jgi:phytoene desaturase
LQQVLQKIAIVIGAGIAGMASACRLAAKGWKVKVFEANATYGGKLGIMQKDGYTFDTGPSLFTQPQNLEELFSFCGKNLSDYFSYTSVPVSCQYFWEDGSIVNAYTDREALVKELQEELGENPSAVNTYLKQASNLYNKIGKIFLNYSLHKLSTWLHPRILPALAATKLSYLFGSLHQHNSQRFKDKRTVQIFDRFATYNGSNPYKTPGMMSMIPHLELNEGTYYPKAGMRSIVDCIYQLAVELGVEFMFNQKVESVVLDGKKAVGIKTDQAAYKADAVLSNCDAYITYKHLLQHHELAAKVLKQERSCSGIIFYWGIKQAIPSLSLHNIFFSDNYEQEFDALFNKHQVFKDPTVYVNISSTQDASHAPANAQNWFVLINAPATDKADWQKMIDDTKQAVLQKLSRILKTDVAALIEVEDILSPALIASKTSSYLGALYGTASNDKYASFLRQSNQSKHYKNLYFCGGSVHPGGGIPLCLNSAKIASALMEEAHA